MFQRRQPLVMMPRKELIKCLESSVVSDILLHKQCNMFHLLLSVLPSAVTGNSSLCDKTTVTTVITVNLLRFYGLLDEHCFPYRTKGDDDFCGSQSNVTSHVVLDGTIFYDYLMSLDFSKTICGQIFLPLKYHL